MTFTGLVLQRCSSAHLTVPLPMEALSIACYGSWRPLTNLTETFQACHLRTFSVAAIFFSGPSLHMAYYRTPWYLNCPRPWDCNIWWDNCHISQSDCAVEILWRGVVLYSPPFPLWRVEGFKTSFLVAKFSFLGYGKGTPFYAYRGSLQGNMIGRSI